jgi:hypothetical protein
MSKFPVTSNDDQGIIGALNYLLSGPSGLGQNFEGFSNYNLGQITGNSRTPYTQLSFAYFGYGLTGENTIVVNNNKGLIVGMTVRGVGIASYPANPSTTTITSIGPLTTDGSIITLSANNTGDVNSLVIFTQITKPYTFTQQLSIATAEMLDSRTYKYTFTTPYTTSDPQRVVPFTLGQPILVYGVADSSYNQTFSPIGVVECTTTYVIARSAKENTVVANSTGGYAFFSITTNTSSTYSAKFNFIHTDCNGLATVNNGTDRVFIAAQLNNNIGVTSVTSGTLSVATFINRYIVTTSTDPLNPGLVYTFDETLTGDLTNYPVSAGFTTIPAVGAEIEKIFVTIIDTPPIGYYWYVVDLAYNGDTPTMQVVVNDLGLRSLSTQVVKE